MCTPGVNSHRMKNMPQGPSCRLTHRAGVISSEAPLLVVSRGGKEVVGGAKKEGQGERFHSYQGRPWQFPGFSFLPVHPCALLGLASSSGHSLLFLDHLIMMTMSLRPLLSSRENQRCRVLPKPALPVWVAPMASLIWRLASASYTALSADHLVPVLTSGCTWRMTSSGESRSIKWSLAFPTLNSSVMDEKGSWSIPVVL